MGDGLRADMLSTTVAPLFGSFPCSAFAASGIRTLSTVNYDGNLNLVLVAVAVGFGILPIAAPGFWAAFPTWLQTIMHSGISAAAIAAVVLNLFFNEFRGLLRTKPSVVTASPPKAVVGDRASARESSEVRD